MIDLVEANNPIAIAPGQPEWEGECTEEWNADTASFKSAVYGYRAGAAWLIWRSDSPDMNTLGSIMAEYTSMQCRADATDYIARLSSITGWHIDEPIRPKSYLDGYRLLRGITILEHGSFPPFKDWQIIEGMRRAGISDIPPTRWHKRYAQIGGGVAVASSIAPSIVSWLSGYAQTIESLNIRWVTLAFHLLAGLGGALALFGGIRQYLRQEK